MRLPVAGLIMLKRTVSASLVAGYKATGHVTRDRRRWPSQDGRTAFQTPHEAPSPRASARNQWLRAWRSCGASKRASSGENAK
jgi:hypothetical protein